MNRQANGSRVSGSLVFLQEFLKHPLQIGSIIPSSRFLERRVVEAAGAADSAVIVELGPGVGGITRALLGAMGPEARLLSIEINPNFHSWVERIGDQRLIAHLGSATDLQEIMAGYALAPPSAVVSGIPFSTMDRLIGSQILATVSSVLPANGRFVAYQVNSQVATLCEPFLGCGQCSMEFLNIPPMRIFQWVKQA